MYFFIHYEIEAISTFWVHVVLERGWSEVCVHYMAGLGEGGVGKGEREEGRRVGEWGRESGREEGREEREGEGGERDRGG